MTKLTQQMTDAARNAEQEKNGQIPVKFQITDKNTNNYAKKYVMLTPDYTKVNLLSKQDNTEEWKRSKNIFLRQDVDDFAKGTAADFKTVKIDENGAFTLPVYLWHKTDNEVVPGNYTLIATVGEYANGKFTPLAKSTSVKVSIPGKAPKALTLKVDGNFTLDESGVPVDIASGVSSAWTWRLKETGREENGVRNYAMNWIDPDTGKPNQFNDFFEVKEVKDANGKRVGYTLGIKKGLKAKDLESLQSETSKDRRGYITIEVFEGENVLQAMDMEINVTLAASEITAKANDSYVGADVAVRFYAGGSTKPINLKSVWLDPASEGGAALKGTNPQKDENKDSNIVMLNLKNAQAGNDYNVTFKIVAEDSAYANLSGAKADASKVGREVKAVLHVCDPADAGNNITIKPTQEGREELAFTAYSADEYKSNTYHLQLSCKSSIDGAEVDKITVGKTVNGKPFEGDGIILANKTELTMKSDKFLKAAAESKTFTKGAYVDVPLTLTFKNRKLTDVEKVVKVKLPNPLSIDEVVKAAGEAVKSVNALDPYDTKKLSKDDIRKDLEKRMKDIIGKALPLDSAGKITRPSTLSSKYKGEGDDKTEVWQAVLTIENPSDKTFTKQEFAIEFNAAKDVVTQSSLVSAIARLTINAEEISEVDGRLDNDYTASDLLRDIKAMLAKQGIDNIPSTLDIEVSTFKITKKATNNYDGSLEWAVKVYDAVTRTRVLAKSGTTAIPKFDNPINNAGAIKTELEKELGDVDKFAGDMSEGVDGLANALAERIEATANKAKIDKSITVDLKSIKKSEFPGGTTWENPGQDEMADDDTVDVLYTIPKKGTPGKIAFKLVLTQPGAKPYEVDCLTKDNVSVTAKGNEFMSLDDADTALGAIWSDGANNTKDLNELIDKNTEDEIQKRIEELIDKALDGSKLLEREVSVTVNEAATDKAGGTATATVTISDKAQRAASGQEYADKVYTVNVTIPQMTTEVTGVTLALDVTKNGKKQDVAITSKEATIENIGIDGCTVKIVPTIEGTWLTEEQKKSVKFAFTKADDSAWTDITGVKPDSQTGVVEIDYSKIAGKDVDVEIKATVTETVTPAKSEGGDPDADRQKESVTITFKFATDAAAKALFDVEAVKAITKGMTIQYQKKAGENAWEIVNTETKTVEKILAEKATEWLKTQDGYAKDFTVTQAAITMSNFATTPVTAKVKFTVGSNNVETDELALTVSPTAKTEANNLLEKVVAAIGNNKIPKDTVVNLKNESSGLKDAAAGWLKTTTAIVLDGATLTVKSANFDDEGTPTELTVKFSVTPARDNAEESDDSEAIKINVSEG